MSLSSNQLSSLNAVVDVKLYQPNDRELHAMAGRLGDKIVKYDEDCNPEMQQRSSVTWAVALAVVFGVVDISIGVVAGLLLHSFAPHAIALGVLAVIAIVAGMIIYDNYKRDYLGIPEERDRVVNQFAVATFDQTRNFTVDEVVGYRLLDGIFKPTDSEAFKAKVYAQYQHLASQNEALNTRFLKDSDDYEDEIDDSLEESDRLIHQQGFSRLEEQFVAMKAQERLAEVQVEKVATAQPQIVVEMTTPTTYSPIDGYEPTLDENGMAIPSAPAENE